MPLGTLKHPTIDQLRDVADERGMIMDDVELHRQQDCMAGAIAAYNVVDHRVLRRLGQEANARTRALHRRYPIAATVDRLGTATMEGNALLFEVIAGADGLDPRQYDRGAHGEVCVAFDHCSLRARQRTIVPEAHSQPR